jgi:hypothetical protein
MFYREPSFSKKLQLIIIINDLFRVKKYSSTNLKIKLSNLKTSTKQIICQNNIRRTKQLLQFIVCKYPSMMSTLSKSLAIS